MFGLWPHLAWMGWFLDAGEEHNGVKVPNLNVNATSAVLKLIEAVVACSVD